MDGGNTFYLQKSILSTKFWGSVIPHLKNNNSIYIGVSAGAIVAGNNNNNNNYCYCYWNYY